MTNDEYQQAIADAMPLINGWAEQSDGSAHVIDANQPEPDNCLVCAARKWLAQWGFHATT